MSTNKGPGMIQPELVSRDASLRLLTSYDVGTDELITRLDVLMKVEMRGKSGFPLRGKQVNAAFFTGSAGESDLILPSRGIVHGVVVRVNAKELAKDLRTLAELIETEMELKE